MLLGRKLQVRLDREARVAGKPRYLADPGVRPTPDPAYLGLTLLYEPKALVQRHPIRVDRVPQVSIDLAEAHCVRQSDVVNDNLENLWRELSGVRGGEGGGFLVAARPLTFLRLGLHTATRMAEVELGAVLEHGLQMLVEPLGNGAFPASSVPQPTELAAPFAPFAPPHPVAERFFGEEPTAAEARPPLYPLSVSFAIVPVAAQIRLGEEGQPDRSGENDSRVQVLMEISVRQGHAEYVFI